MSKWDERFLKMAEEVASWSKDPEVKVGAVVVSPDKRRFTVGYNGFPIGVADDYRLGTPERNGLTVHAELNAILNARCDLSGWTLYTTRAPCTECAKAVAQAGIARVVTRALPNKSSWRESCERGYYLLEEAGVKIDLMEGESL